MGDINYLINTGSFKNEAKRIVFLGKEYTKTDPITGKDTLTTAYGDILLPGVFRSGRISFDATFEMINEQTRCGVIIDYKNTNGKVSFYQVGISNQIGGYSVDYYNGENWEFKLIGGSNGTLQARKKYTIAVDINGNALSLEINGIKVFTYTNYISTTGAFGLFACCSAKVSIENIKTNVQRATVFNIMKFEKDFDELYSDVIVPNCEKYGYKAVRADECYTSTSIIEDIVREISNASVIICDVTMDNPNVFYELGYAHALSKPTILLADVAKRDALPFDISGYRTIFYTNSIGGKKEIEKTLEKFFYNIDASNKL